MFDYKMNTEYDCKLFKEKFESSQNKNQENKEISQE